VKLQWLHLHFLNVAYPIAIVIVMIHSLGVVITALRSIALVVCDSSSPLQAKAPTRLVWPRGTVSRMARDMLLGALITTAGLWFVGITLAICYVVFRV
jgi:hypothetical protein